MKNLVFITLLVISGYAQGAAVKLAWGDLQIVNTAQFHCAQQELRLPTPKMLLAHKNLPDGLYWSSASDPDHPTNAWAVLVSGAGARAASIEKGNKLQVLCVKPIRN